MSAPGIPGRGGPFAITQPDASDAPEVSALWRASIEPARPMRKSLEPTAAQPGPSAS